jgi:hypothetical protein
MNDMGPIRESWLIAVIGHRKQESSSVLSLKRHLIFESIDRRQSINLCAVVVDD